MKGHFLKEKEKQREIEKTSRLGQVRRRHKLWINIPKGWGLRCAMSVAKLKLAIGPDEILEILYKLLFITDFNATDPIKK